MQAPLRNGIVNAKLHRNIIKCMGVAVRCHYGIYIGDSNSAAGFDLQVKIANINILIRLICVVFDIDLTRRRYILR